MGAFKPPYNFLFLYIHIIPLKEVIDMSGFEEIKYTYPVEELDEIVEQWLQGIQPMISSDMLEEVKMRYNERNAELGHDSGEAKTATEQRRRVVEMRKKIEADKRKATRKDAIVLTISDEQKAKIREQMSQSMVRKDPNSDYNKSMDKLYSDGHRRKVYEQLKGLKNCYFNQTDYKNAISIIMEAIEVSLGKYGDSDYPWLTYQQALEEFNAGKIRFTYCELPKLYINYSTIMSDPEILKGIITGEVILKDRNDDDSINKSKGAASKPYKPVTVQYTIEGEEEYERMCQAHNAGYDTPISPFIRTRSRIYNPAAMPINSRFMANTNAKRNPNIPLTWDWEKEGAGIAYYNLIHGYKMKNSDVIEFVKDHNTEKISPDLSTGLTDFLHELRRRHVGNTDYNYALPNYAQSTLIPEGESGLYNQSAADIERALLQSISINSPNR